eukprot:1233588-Rhodomonas_salina.2
MSWCSARLVLSWGRVLRAPHTSAACRLYVNWWQEGGRTGKYMLLGWKRERRERRSQPGGLSWVGLMERDRSNVEPGNQSAVALPLCPPRFNSLSTFDLRPPPVPQGTRTLLVRNSI